MIQTSVDSEASQKTVRPASARDWVQILAKYREPSMRRSLFELAVSLIPFLALWALAIWTAQVSYLAAGVISAFNGLFLLRLFCIQHDCGHGAFLRERWLSDWLGRAIGVLTLTPYDVWRRKHAMHHSHSGNLDHRGFGDIPTLTITEYRQRSKYGRLRYRLYRHPLVMFGIGPIYHFFLENRLPFGLMNAGWKFWASAMGTNLALAAVLATAMYFAGVEVVLVGFLPSTIVAASIGVWLFYVQHQFEMTVWDEGEDWQLHDAALHGSSHYDLPKVLRWLTASIGIHHVHHLYSRIPFYRLTEVLRDHAELVDCGRMTLSESWKCATLDLWDEENRQLISFAAERARAA